MTKFFALDVETANASASSICQIGLVTFQGEKVTETYNQFINPEEYFDPFNISIHGITPEMVEKSPTLPDIHKHFQSIIKNQVVVSHTPFDVTALRLACQDYDLPEITCHWLDSARIVRRHWPEYRHAGYGLQNIAAHIGIDYRAHDAAEDARAAGLVVLQAMRESGLSLDEWRERAYKPIYPNYPSPVKMDGNPEGPLYGENIVFTGSLSISRPQAAQLAAQAGCNVQDTVTQKTTLLVVGIQDMDKLAGHQKSSKHRKAEQLIQKGQSLRIVTEADFVNLVLPRGLPGTLSFF